MWAFSSTRLGLYFATILVLGMAENVASAAEPQQKLTFAIAIHGGAGAWSNRSEDQFAAIRGEME